MASRAAAIGLARLGSLASAVSLAWFGFFYVWQLGQVPAGLPGFQAVAWNTGLFFVFALHHSVFARPAVKRRLERVLPARYERTTYMWAASLLLVLVILLWRPMPGTWFVHTGLAALPHVAVFGLGVWVGLSALRGINLSEFSGLTQATGGGPEAAHGRPAHQAPDSSRPVLRRDGFYRVIRHPLYFSVVCLVFGLPAMTWQQLHVAVMCTVYVAAAIPFEERALRLEFGDAYEAYARDVRWRLVPFLY